MDTRVHGKLEVRIVKECSSAERALADELQELVGASRDGRRLVLGLAAGNTPRGLYEELVARQRAGSLSFAEVTTFNVDELGAVEGATRVFERAMRSQLFERIDLPPDAWHFPSFTSAPEVYEREIRAAGGIDWQLLGLGLNGHVAFNEPGSPGDSRTRIVRLAPETRAALAADFMGLENVPAEGVTVGIATLLEARRLRIIAFGESKRDVVRRFVEGPVSPDLPASLLKVHEDCQLWLDEAAASGLGRDGEA